jgi:hypothetical protein
MSNLVVDAICQACAIVYGNADEKAIRRAIAPLVYDGTDGDKAAVLALSVYDWASIMTQPEANIFGFRVGAIAGIVKVICICQR